MNLLVTGAAGFIGSKLALRLINEGNKVYTLDNLSTGYSENIPKGVELIEGNCQDMNIITRLSNMKFDAIVHIAGQSSGEVSFDNPVYDLQTNTQSTLLLLEYAKKTGCRKFIFASTMSVYGDSEEQPVKEDFVCKPISFYAIGKLASEQYLKTYAKFGVQTISLRLFNVYGPGQNMKNLKQGMVSIYLAQAIKDRKIWVKGSGDRYRDLVYIDDVINSFCNAIAFDEPGNHCFNIGSGLSIRVKDIVDSIKKHFESKLDIVYAGSTPGDMHGICSDSSLAFQKMNWKSKVKFDDGLKHMCDWSVSSLKKL